MSPIWIILTAVVALLLGVIATFSVMKKRLHVNDQLNEESSTVSDDSGIVSQKFYDVKKECEILLSEKSEMSQRIIKLESLIKQKESELKDLTIKLDELRQIPNDTKDEAIIASLKDDLKKSKIQIEDKKEEIEDLEDEISSIKKKLNLAKVEMTELTEKFDSSNKKIKVLERNFKDLELEHNELKNEDIEKSESLNFVNAILTARDADDKDATIINKKVSTIEDIIYDQYIPYLRQYYKGYDTEEWIKKVKEITEHWVNLQRKSWLKRKKVIAFIGEFSAGKTSIVNRILSQDDDKSPKLPVSSKATTAIATYISYGEGFRSQFTNDRGDLKVLSPDMFTKVNKDILSRVNVSSIIQYFVMKYNNQNLKGLSILDTPGFSSNDDQDKDRTLSVIKEADALFWVMDANQGEINRTSLKVIADNVKDIPLFIIINKTDTKAPGELNKLEEHIKETMRKAAIEVREYVRFSQRSPLDGIMNVIKRLPAARTGLDIGNICYNLKRDLNYDEKIYDATKKFIREIKKLLDDNEEKINGNIVSLQDSCGDIVNLPRYNSRLFAKNDYRMDVDEYNQLSNLCENANMLSEQVKFIFDEYKDKLREYHKYTDEQLDLKEQQAVAKKIYSQLINSIQSLDPNLYREIEEAMEKAWQDELKKNQEESESTFFYDDDNTENSHSTNKDQSLTVSEYLKKANKFYYKGAIEEAKFWYKKAAVGGSKEAQNKCKELGIKF